MAANGTPEGQPEETLESTASSQDSSPQVNRPNAGPASGPNYLLYGGIGVGVLVLLLVVGAGAFLFLRDSGPPSAGSIVELAPEDTEYLMMFTFDETMDSILVDAFPDKDPEEVIEGMLGDSTEEFDLDPGDISELVIMLADGDFAAVWKGEFLFEDIRDALEEIESEKKSYRGYEVWGDTFDTVALLEEDGFMIEGTEDGVETLLNNLYREEGSLADSEDSDLKRIIDRLGGAQLLLASTQDNACSSYLSRCRGLGFSFSSFDLDEEEALGNYVLLFSSERAAESAADEYDEVSDFMESDSLDIDDAESDGEFVVGTFRQDGNNFSEVFFNWSR